MEAIGWVYLTNEQGLPVGRVHYDYPVVLRQRVLVVKSIRYEQQAFTPLGWQYQATGPGAGPDTDGLSQYQLALFPPYVEPATWEDVWDWFAEHQSSASISQSKLTELRTLLQRVHALTQEAVSE